MLIGSGYARMCILMVSICTVLALVLSSCNQGEKLPKDATWSAKYESLSKGKASGQTYTKQWVLANLGKPDYRGEAYPMGVKVTGKVSGMALSHTGQKRG